MFTRYENLNLSRIELLLEKILLALQGGNVEQAEETITKCLTEIKKYDDSIKGRDFL